MYTTITGKKILLSGVPGQIHHTVFISLSTHSKQELGLRLWSVQQNYSVVNYCGSSAPKHMTQSPLQA